MEKEGNIEEGLKNLKSPDEIYSQDTQKVTEDGGGAPAAADLGGTGLTTLASVPGMSTPQLASRGVTGSGDVTEPVKKKKKKSKVLKYKDFLDTLKNDK